MSSTTYTNLRIWDGLSPGYSEAVSLTVVDQQISSVGERGPNARDMSGLTVVPGLIDAHVHMTLDPFIASVSEQLAQSAEQIQSKMDVRASEMVRAGITTARDLGGGEWLELGLRDRIQSGEVEGPRLLCAGQPLTSPDGHCHFWGGVASNKNEIKDVIDRQQSHGVDLVKIMATGGMYTKASHPGRAQFSQQQMSYAVSLAKELGLSVAAHCHGTEGIERAVKAGVATVEHCSWLNRDGRRSQCKRNVTREMARRGTWVSPTVNAGWSRFLGGDGKFKESLQDTFTKMRKDGVRFIASTDAGIPNVRHHELAAALKVFSELAGFTPVETLRSATSDSAIALGIEKCTGTIGVGKFADLLFVEGDPLTDLTVLQKPALVVARGQEYTNRS